MVESEAKQLSEEIMLGAVKFGHESMQEVIKIIINLAEECANDPWEFSHTINESLLDEIKKLVKIKLRRVTQLLIRWKDKVRFLKLSQV